MTTHDVLIVGAGASGLAAAAELHANGIDEFVLLEAADRTGGRVQAFEFGDPSVGRLILENGANWVSGANLVGADANPLMNLALDANLSLHRVPGSAANMTNWAVRDMEGHLVDRNGSRRTAVNAIADCVNRTSSTTDVDMSVAEAIRRCGWDAADKDKVDAALMWQPFTGESGMLPEASSLWGALPDPTYQLWGADDKFVMDQNPRGFAAALDAAVRDVLPPGDARLLLNTTVASIAYDCDAVSVSAADGRRWRARHVISTLPAGVLQRGAHLFEPPMPSRQRAALSTLHMANYTKVRAVEARVVG